MTAIATAVRHTPALPDLARLDGPISGPLAPQVRQIRHHVLPRRAARPDMVELAELSARLPRRAGDDGIGFAHQRPNLATSVAGGLANLLDGEIHYFDPMCRGTMAELVFPIL